MPEALNFIVPPWPVPASVHALTTTRRGGVSEGGYAGLNLAAHVGDATAAVASNRQILYQELRLGQPVVWLQQVHGTQVLVNPRAEAGAAAISADAVYANEPGVVCAVLTADCLPLLVTNAAGTEVAAIHAGWRGLAAGVIEATLHYFQAEVSTLQVWLGPAIGPDAFEVGKEVCDVFTDADPAALQAFQPGRPGHYLADLYALARLRLERLGVASEHVYGGTYCTYTQSSLFYSYRRENCTGRMASLIWLDPISATDFVDER